MLGQREPGAALAPGLAVGFGEPCVLGSRTAARCIHDVPRLRSAPGALLPPASSPPFARANCCLGHAKNPTVFLPSLTGGEILAQTELRQL